MGSGYPAKSIDRCGYGYGKGHSDGKLVPETAEGANSDVEWIGRGLLPLAIMRVIAAGACTEEDQEKRPNKLCKRSFHQGH